MARGGSTDGVHTQRLIRGRPREFWVRNCLLLPGDALDPLEATGLHLAQTGITRLLAHFPAREQSEPDRAEYNRLTSDEYDRIRDLLVLHYHATTRSDSPFWDRCRNMAVPDTLARKLALFADSGRIIIGEEEHCGVDGWLAVLLGQGLQPASYDPLAETTPHATARGALAHMAAEMRARAQELPAHREYLARRGASAPMTAARA
jgi:tryptophan halogenase